MYIVRYLIPKFIGLASAGALIGLAWGGGRWYFFVRPGPMLGVMALSAFAWAWMCPAAWLVFTTVRILNEHRGVWHFKKAARRYELSLRRETMRSFEAKLEREATEAEERGDGTMAEKKRSELASLKLRAADEFRKENGD